MSPQVGLCASLLYDTPLGNGLLKNYTDLQTALAEKRRLELTIDQHHHPADTLEIQELHLQVEELEAELEARKRGRLPGDSKQAVAAALQSELPSGSRSPDL